MKRRTVIQYLFITGSVMWALPSCVNETGNAKGQFLNSSEQKLLEELADTIIPSTTTPGAKELGVRHFIEKMVLSCRSPEYQKKVHR